VKFSTIGVIIFILYKCFGWGMCNNCCNVVVYVYNKINMIVFFFGLFESWRWWVWTLARAKAC